MRIGHLYKITRISTGEYYYGIHRGACFDGYWGSGRIIKDYIKTHGTADLNYQVLVISDYGYIIQLESRIVTTAEILKEKCWNLKTGGYKGLHSVETRRLISKAGTGRVYKKDRNTKIQAARAKNILSIYKKVSASNTGKTRTEESCKLISSRKIELMTDECKRQMSLSKTGRLNPAWKGYVETPDGLFESSMVAALYYNVTDTTIRNRIRSKSFAAWQRVSINISGPIITKLNLGDI